MQISGVTGVEYRGKIYFTSYNPIGGLFCFDPNLERTECIKFLEVENIVGLSHAIAYIYENIAWFIPWDSNRIICIDLDTYEDTYFEVPAHERNKTHGYVSFLEWGEELLLVPTGECHETAALINLRTKEVVFFQNSLYGNKCVGGFVYEDKAYFVTNSGSVCSKFDFKERDFYRISDLHIAKRANHVISYGKSVLIMSNKINDICIYDCVSKKSREIDIYNGKIEIEKSDGIAVKPSFFLFPHIDGNRLFCISLFEEKVTCKIEILENVTNESMMVHNISSEKNKNMYMSSGGYIYYLDENGNITKRKRYSSCFDKELPSMLAKRKKTLARSVINSNGIFVEGNLFFLHDFLSLVNADI